MPEDYSTSLQTYSASGVAPSSRIRDARSAYQVIRHVWDANEDRRWNWAQTDRMFDGAPPFIQADLDRQNQSWRSNVPTMTGKAILSPAATTYYDLGTASETFYSVQLDLEPARADDVSRTLSAALDKRLKAWPNLYFREWALINDYVRHGRGFLFWADAHSDWRFRHIRQHRVLVPDGTEIDTEKMDLLVVFQRVPSTFLSKRIRNSGAAASRGWNRSAVIQSIRSALPDDRQSGEDAVDIESSIKDNDIWIDSVARNITLAHLYVREFDPPDSWSHFIVDFRQESSDAGKEFLFSRRNEFAAIEHFFCPFFFEVMNGSWNGASGLGKDIYPMIQHQDRLFNALMDSVYLRTGINLQAQDASSLRRLSSVQIGGGVNIFPPGLNAINASILGDLDGALNVGRMLDITLERNTGIYRPNIEQSKGNPRTLGEVQMLFERAAILANSAVDRWYAQKDRQGAEIWRRVKLDRVLLRELAEESGLTVEELRKADSVVQTSRAIGNGSASARRSAVQALLELGGSFPEAGRQALLNDAIAVTVGQSKVARYNPQPPERDLPTQQQWEAVSENADMSTGASAVRYPTQNDLIHARVHIQFMAAIANSVRQGADPAKAFGVLSTVGPHALIHLQAMANDGLRSDEVKSLNQQWQQLAKIADQLRNLLQQQQQQAQRQAQQSAAANGQQPIDPAVAAKAQTDAAKVALESQVQQGKLAILREKTQAEIQMKQAKTQSDIDARRLQAQAQAQEDLANKESGR